MIKGVIFDCDGVLVDTEYCKFLAWKSMLKKYNIDYTIEEYTKIVGLHHDIIFSLLKLESLVVDKESFLSEKEERYISIQKESGVDSILDAINFLHSCNEENLKIGLATSDNYTNTNFKLSNVGIMNLFDSIVTCEDLKNIKDSEGVNKPKPYIYQIAAKSLNLMTSECIVIEDSAAGVKAARSAGCKVIAVPNKYTKAQDFSLANRILESLKDVKVKELLND